ESHPGEPYLLAAAVENGAAPDVDGGRAPETKPALLAGLDVERDQQAVAGGGELGPADGDVEAAGLVRRKRPACKLGRDQPIDFGERNVDRHREVDPPRLGLGKQIERRRERAFP